MTGYGRNLIKLPENLCFRYNRNRNKLNTLKINDMKTQDIKHKAESLLVKAITRGFELATQEKDEKKILKLKRAIETLITKL